MSDIQLLSDSQRLSALTRAEQQAGQKAEKPPADPIKSPFNTPVFFSPRISIDPATSNAVLQVRDTSTGDIIRQFPPDSVSQIYQTIQDTGDQGQDVAARRALQSNDNNVITAPKSFGEEETEASEQPGAEGTTKAAAVDVPKPPVSLPQVATPVGGLGANEQASSGLTGQPKTEEKSSLDTTV